MIFTLLILNLPLVYSTTDLQNQCNRTLSVYFNNSCLILHPELKRFNAAKISCTDILGYSGHLVHVRSLAYQPVMEALMNASNIVTAWIGTECNGTCAKTNYTGWYYSTPTRRYVDNATFIAWSSSGTSGNYLAWQKGSQSIPMAYTSFLSYSFICEYEEKYAYKITAAAKYCNNTPSGTALSFVSTYVDGSCITQKYNNAPSSLATLRTTCLNVSGLAFRNAHLRTDAKRNAVYSLGRAIVEGLSRADVDDFWYITGLEQLLACSGNACSEEGSYSWFWTTPEGYKWPANTQDSGFWGTGQPTDTTSTKNYAEVHGDDNGYVDCDASTLIGYYWVMCEYVDPYTFTNFTKSCLRSSNPSATGYSSCFTLVRNATTFANAQSRCTEFANGHLAKIDSIQMAQFIRSALWANTGLPPSRPLFTALQQFPQSSTDEPDKQWYSVYPDGSKSIADTTILPWNTGQPQSAGDCASLTQNGFLNTTNCTGSQWFICQYPDPAIPTTASGKYYNHYSFGRFADNSYWLSQATVPFYKCIYMCKHSQSCFGLSYSSTTNDCQLLAVDPSALPYSQQLIDDSQYETVVRVP